MGNKKGIVAIVMLIAGALVLSGCATKNDVSIATAEMSAEVSIAASKSSAVAAQSAALTQALLSAETPLERHLIAEQIAKLEVTPSGIVRSKNGNDVATEGVKAAPGIIRDGIYGTVAWKVADGLADAFKTGGTKVTASEGSTVNLSTNEEHTTSIGDGSAVSKADPIVVEVPVEAPAVTE